MLRRALAEPPPNSDNHANSDSSDRPQSTGIWSNLPSLTGREHGVLLEVMEGGSNKDIAGALEISEQTVKIHLQHIYRKLGVHRRADLLLSRI